MSSDRSAMRVLAQRWRADAADLRKQPWQSDMDDAQADAMDDCAKDLEDLLDDLEEEEDQA